MAWSQRAAWAAQAALWAQGCHELVPTHRAHRQRPRPHLQVGYRLLSAWTAVLILEAGGRPRLRMSSSRALPTPASLLQGSQVSSLGWGTPGRAVPQPTTGSGPFSGPLLPQVSQGQR